ncbi:hypothetical protein EMIT047CA2_80271 [Pseudomonas soli]
MQDWSLTCKSVLRLMKQREYWPKAACATMNNLSPRNFRSQSSSYPGSHWSRPPAKLAALP